MKKIFLGLMAATALFASCTKNEGTTKAADENGAKISIKFDASILQKSRAFDDLDGTNQDRVTIGAYTPIYVYFFDGIGNLVGSEFAESAASLTSATGKTFSETDGINTSITKVVLVANVADGLAVPIGHGGINSYADLQAYYQSVEELNSLVIAGGKPAFWLVGESGINWTGVDENGITQGNATLGLHPIFSRIDVKVRLDEAQDGLYQVTGHTNKHVDLKSVDILYGGTYGNFTTSTPSQAELQANGMALEYMTSGIIPNTADNYWSSWNNNGMRRPANQLINTGYFKKGVTFNNNIQHGNYATPNTDANMEYTKSFYVYPNPEDAVKSVIATLYGERDVYAAGLPTGETVPVFWPVHFNGDPNRPKIEQGKVYTVTLVLKGDYTDPTTGEPDPEDPAKDANITIIVDEVAWEAVVDLGEVPFDE